jgi:excisionase family DNA binding protein
MVADKSPPRLTAGHCLSIDQFCELENIARSTLYKLWREGRGPRFHQVGKVRRITEEARREWQQKLEPATSEGRAA